MGRSGGARDARVPDRKCIAGVGVDEQGRVKTVRAQPGGELTRVFATVVEQHGVQIGIAVQQRRRGGTDQGRDATTGQRAASGGKRGQGQD